MAFCKISETRHDFARLRYVKEDGLPAFIRRIFWCAVKRRFIWSKPRRKGR
jgi:hypothetical protein